MANKLVYFLIVSVLWGLPHCAIAHSKVISGFPRIIDGDTIAIGEYVVRLKGIDAPEMKQECRYLEASWSCGIAARNNLVNKTQGNEVSCQIAQLDRYNRHLGVCFLGEEDLNSWLVLNGFAVAYTKYSRKYMDEEMQAIEDNKGIWSSDFQLPEEYRKTKKPRKPRKL